MQGAGVIPAPLETAGGFFVYGRQQRAGTASEIRNSKRADRLGIRPINVVNLCNCQLGQERCGSWQRVVSGEVLSVADESLEYAPCQVVRVSESVQSELAGGAIQGLEEPFSERTWQLIRHCSSSGKDRPVVNLQYFVPNLDHSLFVGQPSAANEL